MKKKEKLLAIRPTPGLAKDSSSAAKDPDALKGWKQTTYKIGDGDHNVYVPRPGSDHKHLKSKGDLT